MAQKDPGSYSNSLKNVRGCSGEIIDLRERRRMSQQALAAQAIAEAELADRFERGIETPEERLAFIEKTLREATHGLN